MRNAAGCNSNAARRTDGRCFVRVLLGELDGELEGAVLPRGVVRPGY